MKKLSIRGITLLELAIAASILGVGIMAIMRTSAVLAPEQRHSRENYYAELSATELLEFFRAHTSGELVNYLKTTPSAATPFFLCSHIGILDRTNNVVVNPDALTTLPTNSFGPDTAIAVPNRYYQVHVVDMTTMAVNKGVCDKTAVTMPALGANERIMVTVGVSWLEKVGGVTGPRSKILTTILAKN